MSNLPNYGFNKQQRLLNAADFRGVFDQTSFKSHQSHLLFFVRVVNGGGVSRVGMAITKKKVKHANERNRIKRLTREYFRLHQAEFVVPVDIVLTVKQSTKDLTNAQINEQIHQAFFQIHQKIAKSLK